MSRAALAARRVSFFDAFGELAECVDDPTVVAGRYPFQAEDEQSIVVDVITKLAPQPGDRLLEIGFGTGLLLLSLAGMVDWAAGVDHSSCVARLVDRAPANVSLVAGQWPDTRPNGQFDRVLAYSVLHYVADRAAAAGFIDCCVAALAPGGVLLVGDLPNENARQRFVESEFGRRFTASWRQEVARCEDDGLIRRDQIFARVSEASPFIDDDFILGTIATYRRLGLDAYVLPQGPSLPFGHTREDLVIRRSPA